MEGHFPLLTVPSGPEEPGDRSTAAQQPRANRPNKQGKRAGARSCGETSNLRCTEKDKNKEESLLDTDWGVEKELKEQRRT